MHRVSATAFLAFGFLVLASLSAGAHSALVSCFDNKDGTITCEAGYSDGAPSKGQTVRVLTAAKRLLREDRFGDDGTYTFAKPKDAFVVEFEGDSSHIVDFYSEDLE